MLTSKMYEKVIWLMDESFGREKEMKIGQKSS